MGRVKTWKGGYVYKGKQQIVDNISGYHFTRICWDCNTKDTCRCNPALVHFYRNVWYRCLACKIKKGEVTEDGHPLR